MIIIIPCYNEGHRLKITDFEGFLKRNPTVTIVFSNDGSVDNTAVLLEAIRSQFPDQVHIFHAKTNKGKAAAVRAGVLYAHEHLEFGKIAYLDADLSTSLEECLSISKVIKNDVQFAFASRILKIDNTVERKYHRFLIGRILATIISNQLGLAVYDTQCGCKVLTKELSKLVFNDAFISKWLFDIEIFHRIIQLEGRENMKYISREIPVQSWIDTNNSKVKFTYFFRLWYDIIKIGSKYNHAK